MGTTSLRALACGLSIVLCLSAPAAAQWWDDTIEGPERFDISASAGFLMPTDWSDLVVLGTISPAFGVLEQVLVQNVRVEPDRKFTANATFWRGRYGVRGEVGYSRSQLIVGGLTVDEQERVGVRTWTYGLRGAIGLMEYTPGQWFWPYGFGGIGGITYDLSRPVAPPLFTFIELGGDGAGQPGLIITDQGREFVLSTNQLDLETMLAFSYGLGVDISVPGPAGIGVRLELSDTVARSPVRVHIREVGVPGSATDVGLGRVHHLRATAGVMVRFGR